MKSTPGSRYIGKTEKPISEETFEEIGRQLDISKEKIQTAVKFFCVGAFQIIRDWLFEDNRIPAEEEADLIFFAFRSSDTIYQYILDSILRKKADNK